MENMKIQVASDLHIEFQADDGKTILDELQSDADILLLAGDLAPSYMLSTIIPKLEKKFNRILYVPGNHDYYFSSIEKMTETFKNLSSDKFTVLDNDVVEIGGQRFVGSLLWYKISEEAILNKHMLNDFHYIADSSLIFRYGKRDHEFLRDTIREEDIVITHVMPSMRSVNEKFRNSPINCYFIHDVEKIIKYNKPKIWVHGHTHLPCEYVIHKTKVICNPLGYVNRNENPDFESQHILTI